jgi:hypothetical protein
MWRDKSAHPRSPRLLSLHLDLTPSPKKPDKNRAIARQFPRIARFSNDLPEIEYQISRAIRRLHANLDKIGDMTTLLT